MHVDGIYCLNDMLARGAIETLHDWDLRVPEDVEVIGHDNWAVTATECRVPITSFDNNLQEIGRRAARQLLDAIKGNPHHGTTYIGCSLVTRKSYMTISPAYTLCMRAISSRKEREKKKKERDNQLKFTSNVREI